MRARIALVAAAASLSLGLIAVPAAQASNGTTVPPKITALPALYTLHNVAGVAKNGKKFNGSYAIQRFIVRGHKVVAYGTLKGTLNGHHVRLYGVKIPAKLTGDTTSTGSAPAARAAATCQVLHLVLGPVTLNLLGLNVTLGGGPQGNGPIVLDITADSNGGLLGQLLCGLTQQLSGTGILGQLSTELQQLASTLNALTSILGSL